MDRPDHENTPGTTDLHLKTEEPSNLSLHPGKSYITYLFFETPMAVSQEARLSLSAGELGGSGVIQLRVPISGRRPMVEKK